jgi:hypothetical protein
MLNVLYIIDNIQYNKYCMLRKKIFHTPIIIVPLSRNITTSKSYFYQNTLIIFILLFAMNLVSMIDEI